MRPSKNFINMTSTPEDLGEVGDGPKSEEEEETEDEERNDDTEARETDGAARKPTTRFWTSLRRQLNTSGVSFSPGPRPSDYRSTTKRCEARKESASMTQMYVPLARPAA